MAETPNVSDPVLESITGHLSKRIRLAAKRRAFDLLEEQREQDRQSTSDPSSSTTLQ
jgi:hypothetical protein